jgi:hypothetical protein
MILTDFRMDFLQNNLSSKIKKIKATKFQPAVLAANLNDANTILVRVERF